MVASAPQSGVDGALRARAEPPEATAGRPRAADWNDRFRDRARPE